MNVDEALVVQQAQIERVEVAEALGVCIDGLSAEILGGGLS